MLLHTFGDISNTENTGKAINDTYLYSQPSQAHVINLQNDAIISKWWK